MLTMPFGEKNLVFTSEEAIRFLRISKPTFLKYVRSGRIRAVRAGKGYRVLYPELLRFLNASEVTPGDRSPRESGVRHNAKGLEDDG